jgi:hypothetical protein
MKPDYWRLLTSCMIMLIIAMGLQKSMAQTIISISAVQAPALVADAGENATIDVGEEITIGGSPTATGGTGSYTYQWNYSSFLDNPAIANPVGIPPGSLTFYVTVTDEEGCTDSDGVYITVIGGTGINDSETNTGLSVFPNPGNGVLTIVLTGIFDEKQIKISITNLSGQRVYENICNFEPVLEKEIDMSYLSKGFYILTIDGKSTHLERQLIIQ